MSANKCVEEKFAVNFAVFLEASVCASDPLAIGIFLALGLRMHIATWTLGCVVALVIRGAPTASRDRRAALLDTNFATSGSDTFSKTGRECSVVLAVGL